MMNRMTVRDAGRDEVRSIVQMIRSMVADMANYGGHAPTTDDAALENVAAAIVDELKGNNTKYLIAESAGGNLVGLAAAKLVTLEGVFAPKKTLHISVVYVPPQFRRSGIGGALVAKLMDWGRTIGAEQCDLNVLTKNPARSLYEKHGFEAIEVKMVCSL
jgi:ribosomal protein S18 acetylase RimI-like enzyme